MLTVTQMRAHVHRNPCLAYLRPDTEAEAHFALQRHLKERCEAVVEGERYIHPRAAMELLKVPYRHTESAMITFWGYTGHKLRRVKSPWHNGVLYNLNDILKVLKLKAPEGAPIAEGDSK